MTNDQLDYIKNLKLGPTLDTCGKWVHIINAKTASRSISNEQKYGGILSTTAVRRKSEYKKWEYVWDTIIKPNSKDVLFFTFVRNPWDRCVSAFFHMKQSTAKNHHIKENIAFDDYVLNTVNKSRGWHNVHWYPQDFSFAYNNKINKEIFVGRFESLQEDWRHVANILQVNPILPWIGKTEHKDYRIYYNQETHDVIADVYQKEIELLGYKFDK